jgi:hypothetical protein
VPNTEDQINELRSAVTSLARRFEQPAQTLVRRTTNNVTNVTQASGPGFTLIDEVPLADSGSYSGVSGDWNTLDVSGDVSSSATMAYVRFRGVCIQNTEAITLKARAESGANEKTPIENVPMGNVGDTCSNDNAEWIPLSSSKTFDYQPTYAVAPAWSVTLLGYA